MPRTCTALVALLLFGAPVRGDAQSCHKWEAGLFYTVPSTHASTTNAARASWSTRSLEAPGSGNFTLVALQVATGDKAPPPEDDDGFVPFRPYQGGGMVEVGHQIGRLPIAGGGSIDGPYYFTFHITPSGTFESDAFEDGQGMPIQWTVNGASQAFSAGSCESSPPPIICQSEPATTAWACIQNGSTCYKWVGHGPAGTKFFALALEASCGNDTDDTLIDKHYIKDIQYRTGSNWTNFTSPLPFKGITMLTASGPATHGGNADFDIRPCVSSQPNKILGWLHDNQTNPSCN